MIVSWNWLRDYVELACSHEEFTRRLMMAGLNHESTTPAGGDLAIDLEVTSNRPDCLGHIGVAREAAVLFGRPLVLPKASPREAAAKVDSLTSVAVECSDLCPRFTARVIRGVKIGPSPKWLVDRLATLGIAAINNVVDVTNYVLMECGQPLHAYDLARLAGRRLVVRRPKPGETLEAINHKTYELTGDMCVICDSERPQGIGGVMGGAPSEVGPATRDLLIEAAEFDPANIRTSARRLSLHSDSSYRFERGLDSAGVDWASRRCCELILDLCGGELAAGVIDVGRRPMARAPVSLRFAQLTRVLGIDVPAGRAREILAALGAAEQSHDALRVTVVPPSWRNDLSREIDLIEEVARIHGYEAIPEDVSVPMATSARTDDDRVLERVRHVLSASGFDEALTVSIVDEDWSSAISPWTKAEPLVAQMPLLRRADRLRRSLLPSLLGARRTNEALANRRIELFEIARVYLPRAGALPSEELMIGLTSGGDFFDVKGVIEALVAELQGAQSAAGGEPPKPSAIEVRDAAVELLRRDRSCELWLAGQRFAVLGELDAAGLKRFELRSPTTVAELRVAELLRIANLVPRYEPLSPYPSIARDLNLVVDERVRWSDLAATVRRGAGPYLEDLEFVEVYRDRERVGQGKKSLVFSVTLRDARGTLTNEQADTARDAIVAACGQAFGAVLRA